MAEVKLNTSTSIVDFLKSKGQESSFSARRKLFQEGGFEQRLGTFTGTAAQNLALLRSMQQSDRAAPVSAQDTLNQVGAPTPAPAAPFQAPTTTPAQTTLESGIKTTAAQPGATQAVDAAQGQSFGSFNLTQVPTPEPVTADQILKQARGETGVQFAEKEAQIKKQRVDAALPQQLSDIRSNFASRGLVFSGARSVSEQGARDTALANQLDIDLQFAKILGGAIDRAEVELGKRFEEVVAAAQDQRKEEVNYLKSIGLAVNPETGELTPTLEAQRFQLQSAMDALKFQQQQAADERAARKEEAGEFELRTVGKSLVRTNPTTGEFEVLFSSPTGTGTPPSLSLQELTNLGLPISLLGQDEREVLGSLGQFTPPTWFKDAKEGEVKQSLVPDELQDMWDSFRAGLVTVNGQKKFLDTDFFTRLFPEGRDSDGNKVDTNALLGTVSAYRDAGFNDNEILDLMQ